MKKQELDYILQNGESYYVEFKENVNKSLTKEITAFANASGGKIYVGISDTDEIKGIKITNKLKSQIQDSANNCFPSVPITIEEYNNILIIHVPEGIEKPYQCSDGFYSRNQIIASLLHRINFVENMGTGISKIKNLMKAENIQEPEFDFGNFFTVTFYRKNGSEIGSEISSEIILELMKENPKISARLLGEKIGISQRAVEKTIQKFKKDGIIKRFGSPKDGYWKVLK
jgi:ATP-dependent DNA helicase RecG